MMQKEIYLLLVPVLYLHAGARRGWRAALPWLALGTILPLAVHLVVRSAVEPVVEFSSLEGLYASLEVKFRQGWLGWLKMVQATLVGLGALVPMALVRPRASVGMLRREPWWLALLLAGIAHFLAGGAMTRLIAPQAILFVALVAEIVDRDPALTPRSRAVFLALGFVLHLYLGWHLSPVEGQAFMRARMLPAYQTELSVVVDALPGLPRGSSAGLSSRSSPAAWAPRRGSVPFDRPRALRCGRRSQRLQRRATRGRAHGAGRFHPRVEAPRVEQPTDQLRIQEPTRRVLDRSIHITGRAR